MSQQLPKQTTRLLKVGKDDLGKFKAGEGLERIGEWELPAESESLKVLREAASYLKTKDTPVGFPTETVYGLGADATRTPAVKGIYTAKGRPSDNPLIIHVPDLEMLRRLLRPAGATNGATDEDKDPIPEIYKPLFERFWPGPLTVLMPNPSPSHLAPEVTAGLPSFGARMPSSPLALSLIKLTGVPLAAPSANASTKPSPTTADHVLHDLDGRIELILDGGPCEVGVESTVVDGLCDPPVILRPGGVSLEELRTCPGWENVATGYKDQTETGSAVPRAPGMKYKHYSPKAKVVLYESSFEAGKSGITQDDSERIRDLAAETAGKGLRVGLIRTRHWSPGAGLLHHQLGSGSGVNGDSLSSEIELQIQEGDLYKPASDEGSTIQVGRLLDVSIGQDAKSIAQGLFSALRALDQREVDIIFVEGIDDNIDIAAAVMNRLRKAASDIRS